MLGGGAGKTLAGSPPRSSIFRLHRKDIAWTIATMAKEDQDLAGITGLRTEATRPLNDLVPERKAVLALLMPLLWAAALVLPGFGAHAAAVLTTLHSFHALFNAVSSAGLVLGRDGSFYGTTVGGGNFGLGTVFKISTNAALTTLYSFTGDHDGAGPAAGLVQGSDGSFYGTTFQGGRDNSGTVFKISTNGTLTTLHSFTGGTDGGDPVAAPAQGTDGFFYGTTSQGGPNNSGTVFKISADGALTTLYSFTGGKDGSNPVAGLAQGTDGFFYGTTSQGGANSTTPAPCSKSPPMER